MGTETTGQITLRAENVSKLVTGFALENYRMMQLCMVDTSSAWIETYYKESKAELTGGTGANIKGIPRLSNFPYAEVSFTKVSSYIEKYGCEGVISIEDARTNNIPVLIRTTLRIGRSVAFAIDRQIQTTISGASGINTLAVAAGYEWDSATINNRDPIKNILDGKVTIAVDNYDPDNGNLYIVMDSQNYANLMGNSKVINNPSYKGADVVSNGVVGRICGGNLLVAQCMPADDVYLIIAKEALTWKDSEPLKVVTIEDPMIKWTVRAGQMGVCQVPNPEAICKITNVRA